MEDLLEVELINNSSCFESWENIAVGTVNLNLG